MDNLYVIEEIVKNITKDLTLKKYKNFVSLSNGRYAGFARIYVLAAEMVAYTDGKIDNKNLEEMLRSYQNKRHKHGRDMEYRNIFANSTYRKYKTN